MARDHVEARLESNDFPCDHVQIARLSGREAMGRIAEFDLQIVVTEPEEIDIDGVPGAEVDIVFELSGTELRRFHGMVVSVEDPLDSEPSFRSYRLRICPRAYRLSLVEMQEVFVDQTVPEIIKGKLALVGLGDLDVDMRLLGSYPKRDLVVQYKESDLAFVSRLAEHLGVAFFFEQHDGRDVIVFTDHASGMHPIEGPTTVPFHPRGEKQDLYRLESSRRLMPATWVLHDYNYRTPHADLTAMHESPAGFAGGVVEYGGHHKNQQEGKALAKIRAEEREAATRFYTGESDVCQIAAGSKLSIDEHPRLDNGTTLNVVEVTHELTQVVAGHGGSEGAVRYHNTFRAIAGALPFRPARITPKPRIDGVATAIVEPRPDGSLGRVAQIDDQGRYTIKFLFDMAPLGERNHSSHRVRMIQQHSGPNYGTHMPIKQGIEALVVFVDGDPDRPLIVGTVHNPVTPSPVVGKDPNLHRIKTASGIVIEMRDEF